MIPRKKTAAVIEEQETPPDSLTQTEETPETIQLEAEQLEAEPLAAEPIQEPEKASKAAAAKAKRQRKAKDEQIEQTETPPVDKRQLILPDAENLSQEELTKESENKDEEAAEIVGIEQASIELRNQSIVETSAEPVSKPMALKLSVSLYERDIESLDNIRGYLRGHGIRKLTDSEAIRIAIRATAPNQELIEIFEQLKLDDKRRK